MAKQADRRKSERSGGASKTALVFSVIALCLLLGVGAYALLSFRQGTLNATLIRLLKLAGGAAARWLGQRDLGLPIYVRPDAA